MKKIILHTLLRTIPISSKLLLFLFFFLITGVLSAQTTVNFAYTGASVNWTVPPCVYSISVDVRGAKGGGPNGGNGARVTHPNIAVTPGQVLQIRVGGMGTIPGAGFNGGGNGTTAVAGYSGGYGGGGASDIRVAPYTNANRIVVAGGGGGTGGGNTNGLGGFGGCATGGNGASPFGQGGFGGTQVSGGAGGPPWIASGNPGTAGSLGQGGNGGSDPCYNRGPGGGGGGGYYGGGGGGSDCFGSGSLGGGGGGGGSSFNPAGGACTQGFNNTNGSIAITYTGGSPVLVAANTGPYCEGTTISLTSTAGGIAYDWVGPNGFTSNVQNPTIASSAPVMSGMYIVTMTAPGGCTSVDTTVVIVNPLPVPTANNTGPYCEGDLVQLNSPAGSATDDWTGPGFAQNDIQNPTLTPAAVVMSGTYTVTVTNAFNCSATATTDVVVNALPIPTANNTGPYCEGDIVDITSSGGVDYDWIGPGGFVLANTQNTTIPAATMNLNGTYTVTVTDANNCSATASTSMVVNLLPIPTANNTGPYCEGDPINLSSSGGADYSWTGPGGYVSIVQNPTLNPSVVAMSGTYNVVVTSAQGCIATASTDVTVTALPIPTASNTGPYCDGQTVQLNSTGASQFAWVGPVGFGSILQNPVIGSGVPANTGTYTVTATDGANCSATATTDVIVYPHPTSVPLFSPQNPTTLSPEVDFFNESYANISAYHWDIAGTTYNTPDFMHEFTEPGTYDCYLVVTSQWGCVDTAMFEVTVEAETSIYIPNSFTPNNDGLNEIFFVYGENWYRMEVIIFDRWGKEVFYSDDPSKGWDGTLNNSGELLMQGTYAYTVHIIDFYGKEHNLMGHINLLR